MAKIGRNDPCPCGSGKKYKKCCLLKEQVPTVTRLVLLKASEDLLGQLLKYFRKTHEIEGVDGIEEAWEDFSGYNQESSFDESPYEEMFVRWMLYLWIPEDEIEVEKEIVYPSPDTVAARFLRAKRRELDSITVKYLEAALRDPLSFWQVEAITPDRGIMARDMITGRERFIEDYSITECVHKWDIILANIVEVDGTCVFNVIAPYMLPATMVENIRDTFGIRGRYPEDRLMHELFASDYDFIWHYHKLIDEMTNSPMPALHNTDGDEIVITKSTYEFNTSDRIDIVDDLIGVDEFELDPGDKRGSVLYTWKEPSQNQSVSDSVVKGTIKVKRKYLDTECNSAERNESLSRKLKDILGDRILHRKTTSEYPDEMMTRDGAGTSDRKSATEPPDLKELPEEVRAEINEHMEQQYMNWADVAVPRLKNLTPREAVATEDGRAEVALMINEWENLQARIENPQFVFDFDKLRAELKLPFEQQRTQPEHTVPEQLPIPGLPRPAGKTPAAPTMGTGESIKAKTPTLKEHKTLYDLAKQFKTLGPWEWMYDGDLFGVQHPETGEIGWCCVLGNLGQVFGLVVYRGTEGVDGFLKIHSGEVDIQEPDSPHYQKCLMASFEDRDHLEQEDRDIIKQLGLKFRGRGAWPLFRNYEPGFVPWFITSDDATFLMYALEQALDVASRFAQDEGLLYPDHDGTCLVRTPRKTGEGIIWRDEYTKLPPAPLAPPLHDRIDEVRVQRIKKQSKTTHAVWEIGYCYAPTPIREKRDQRPFYPKMLAVLEQENHLALTVHLAEGNNDVTEFREHLLGLFERLGHIPKEIVLNRDNAAQLLAPITTRLEIHVRMVKQLPVFDDFYFSMFDYMK